MSGKYALIIGNTEYADPGLAQLTAPGKDVEDFVQVLKDREICAFDDVKILLNQPEHIVRRGIDVFFDQKKPDDLLVLYFSGHGVRDELGALYLAVKNTIRSRLRSTAVKSDYIREAMDQSRSKRQVLILDCCNSGAFAQGTKAATGVSIGTATAFEAGYGRVILTASDSTQYAWEGDKIIGEGKTDNSLFTHYLVEGLEGEADLDSDGRITVDELYDYAYEQVKLATPNQTPCKWSYKQSGEIVLRQISWQRGDKHLKLDGEVAETATPTPDIAKVDTQWKAEQERIAHEKIKPRWVAVIWITFGWATAAEISEGFTNLIGGRWWALELAIGGVIGGLATAIILRVERVLSGWKSMLWVTLGWAIGWAMIGELPVSSLATSVAIGAAIGGFVTAITLRIESVFSDWKSMFWMTLGWTIAWTVTFIGVIALNFGAIGWATSAAIGGFVMIWQIRRAKI